MRDQQLLKMHEAVTGDRLRAESDPQVIWKQLAAGVGGIPLTLRWFAGQSDYHSLVLSRVQGDRVHFHNPIRPRDDFQPGTPLRDDAPLRLYHTPGDESVNREEFESWFRERDALGYLPPDA